MRIPIDSWNTSTLIAKSDNPFQIFAQGDRRKRSSVLSRFVLHFEDVTAISEGGSKKFVIPDIQVNIHKSVQVSLGLVAARPFDRTTHVMPIDTMNNIPKVLPQPGCHTFIAKCV